MPYYIRKAPNKNLYWVQNRLTNYKHSKDPIPLDKAEKQLKALMIAEFYNHKKAKTV